MRTLAAFLLSGLFAFSAAGSAFAGCGGSGGYLVDHSGPTPVVLADSDPHKPSPPQAPADKK